MLVYMNKTETLPKEWKLVRLANEELFELVMGQSPPSQFYNKEKKGLPFLQGNADFGSISPAPTIYCSKATKIAKSGDILISVRAPVGEVNIAKQDFCIGRGIGAIRVKDNINETFLFYYLKSIRKKINSVSAGSTFKAITKSQLEKLEIKLPPLNEQQQISLILSSVDSALDIVERVRRAVERLKVGVMKKLFDGKGRKFDKIENLFYIETGTTPSTKEKGYWDKGTIEWITPADMKDLNNNIELPESKRKITLKGLNETNLTLMPKGSIIISTRAPVGYVGIAKRELTFNQGCKGLIPKDKNKTNTIFYAYYLTMLKKYLNNLSGGSTFKELPKEALAKLEVPILDIQEQKKVVEILSTLDSKLSLQSAQREKLERVKQGLMNDLLTGKKRVKVGK
jgi:type I restriction enzyme S subunit